MDASQLAHQLAALDQPELRARRAAALLAEVSSDDAVTLLSGLVRLASARENPSSAALEAALGALHLVDEPVRARLREAATRAGAADVQALLSTAAAARAFDRDREPWVDREMRALTLGERKQLARSHDRDLLARLATDPDPAVLRHLLQNPRFTEREVLVAAARRPAKVAVLEEIFRSRRWSSNRRVRRALALNPYSPPALAVAALSLLTAPDLREIAHDENLAPEVREHARRLLAQR